MADVDMEVTSWSGEWGLPSIDIDCLEVLTYAKFSGCPLKVNKHNNPWKSPTWSLPIFKSNSKVLTSPRQIMDFLREKNFNADYQLTARQGADTLAFAALIEQKLKPALQYTLWVDLQNYKEFTRVLYAKRLPIPLSFIIPGQMAKVATNMVHKGHSIEEDKEETFEKKIFKDAMDCLGYLSVQLGDKPFFFGENPTTLDAIAFAHLAVIWRTPVLPNNKLKNHLMGFDNLISFCSRVLQRYFPVYPEDNPEQPKPSTSSSSDQSPNSTYEEDPYQNYKLILSVGIATVAMASYAVMSGLVNINSKFRQRQNDSEDGDEMEYIYEDDE